MTKTQELFTVALGQIDNPTFIINRQVRKYAKRKYFRVFLVVNNGVVNITGIVSKDLKLQINKEGYIIFQSFQSNNDLKMQIFKHVKEVFGCPLRFTALDM